MKRTCLHSNEPSGSIKFWEILVERLAVSQEALSSLVREMHIINSGMTWNCICRIALLSVGT
jgi:hypothetical protein